MICFYRRGERAGPWGVRLHPRQLYLFHTWPKWSAPTEAVYRAAGPHILRSKSATGAEGTATAMIQHRTCEICGLFQWRRVVEVA